ncbi:hypothetical protein [Caballeronia sordidicola]|nr:hypothetical protein [Caballeronia sordidicola]
MSKFRHGFLPLQEHRDLTASIIAAIADSAESRKVDNPRFKRLFYSLPQVLVSGKPLEPRENLESDSGAVFTLMGRSGTGRSAFLRRLRSLLGPPVRVLPTITTAPPQIWYIPMVKLDWPACNTVEGLCESFRKALVAEIKDPLRNEEVVLRHLQGAAAVHAVVAACVIFNVGLLAIDGACAHHVAGQYEGILQLVLELKRYNIPVVLSCSELFFQRAALGPPFIREALGTQVSTLDVLPPAPVEKERRGESPWQRYCLWFWKAGLFCQDTFPMPAELVHWTYEVCLGRVGWLSVGFGDLHLKLIRKPALLTQLDKKTVTEIFERALLAYEDVRRVIGAVDNNEIIDSDDFMRCMDHFSSTTARTLKMTAYLEPSRGRRARR